MRARKFLNMTACILSALTCAALLLTAIYSLMGFDGIKNTITGAMDGLYGIKLLERTSLSVFMAIIAIILAFLVALFRAAAATFYFTVFKRDKDFYDKGISGIVWYSVAAFIMTVVFAYLSTDGIAASADGATKTYLIALFSLLTTVYGLLCILPLISLLIYFFSTDKNKNGGIKK